MKTFAEFSQLDEGRQAKIRAERRAEKLAKSDAIKKSGQMPASKYGSRPPAVDNKNKKEYAGQQKPGALAVIPKKRDIGAERKSDFKSQVRSAPKVPTRNAAADKASNIVRQKNDSKVNRPTTSQSTTTKPTTDTKPPLNRGFMSGVKSSLGGDVFDKNSDSNRKRARRQLGLKTGNAIKSAPGKAVSLLKKSMPKITAKSVGGGNAEIQKSDVKSFH